MKTKNVITIFFILAVVSFLLHNAVYAFTHVEEAVFFTLTFIFGIGTIVILAYTAVKFVRGKTKL